MKIAGAATKDIVSVTPATEITDAFGVIPAIRSLIAVVLAGINVTFPFIAFFVHLLSGNFQKKTITGSYSLPIRGPGRVIVMMDTLHGLIGRNPGPVTVTTISAGTGQPCGMKVKGRII
jgi:hypothetical protein